MIRRKEILQTIMTLPPLPDHLQGMINSAEVFQRDTDAFVAFLEKYPAWQSKSIPILQNNYFCTDNQIPSSFPEIILGGQASKAFQILLTVGIIEWIKSIAPPTQSYPWRLWEHSLAVALGMEQLGHVLAREAPAYTFLTGYFHDIGKFAMEHFIHVDMERVTDEATRQEMAVNEAERLILNIDHMEIGSQILTQWNFPEDVIDAVRWHHLVDSYPRESLLLDLLHVADAITLMMGIGPHQEGLHYQTSSTVKKRLKLKTSMIETAASITEESFQQLNPSFESLYRELD